MRFFVGGSEGRSIYLPQSGKWQGAPCTFSLFTLSAPCRVRSLSPHPSTKKDRQTTVFFALVDPRGIEPLSENSFTGLSSWAVCDLNFPLCVGHRRSTPAGSPFLHDRYKCELPMHVHHYMTLQPRPWYSPGERAAKKPRHCLIRDSR